MDSIAKTVEETLAARPFLLKALEDGYANSSAVARLLHDELKRKRSVSKEAVRAAVNRFAFGLAKQRRKSEDRIMRLLKSSRLELSTKVAVVVVAVTAETEEKMREWYLHVAALTRSKTCFTVILDESLYANFMKAFRSTEVLIANKGLVALTVVSPASLEEVPGVVAFVTGKLADEGINIKEVFSSYTDTVLVLEGRDAFKAFKSLESVIC